MFYLQINGEALWQWRIVKKQKQMFEVLQDNLFQLGYRLSSSCKDRAGALIYARVNYLTKGPKPYEQLKSSRIEIKLLV